MDEVIIVDYDPRWPELFQQEARRVQIAVPGCVVEHIGSTSVKGLAAKPIIDLLVGVGSIDRPQPYIPALQEMGYEYRGEQGVPGRLFFLKRNSNLLRTHHLHMTVLGGAFWRDHVAFRERLRRDPGAAATYEAVKRNLADRYRNCRERYTQAKSRYIERVMRPDASLL